MRLCRTIEPSNLVCTSVKESHLDICWMVFLPRKQAFSGRKQRLLIQDRRDVCAHNARVIISHG